MHSNNQAIILATRLQSVLLFFVTVKTSKFHVVSKRKSDLKEEKTSSYILRGAASQDDQQIRFHQKLGHD